MSVSLGVRAELERLLKEATPRPWRRDTRPDGQWDFVLLGEVFGEDSYGFDCTHDIPQARKDARLIAAAVNALPGLLADLTAAEDVLAECAAYFELYDAQRTDGHISPIVSRLRAVLSGEAPTKEQE